RTYGAARGVERVDDGLVAVDFFRALDCRARDHRGGRRLRVGGRAEFDYLYVMEAARVEVLAEKFDDERGREVWDESEVETRGGVRNYPAPLRVQVRARAVGSKLKEGDALEAEVDDESFFRVLVAIVPDASVGAQKLRVLFGELVEARTRETVLALDEEA